MALSNKIERMAQALNDARPDSSLLDALVALDDDTLSRLLGALRTEAARRYAIALAGAERWRASVE